MDTTELRAQAEPAAWNIHAKGWGEELRFSEAGAKELVARLRIIPGVKEPTISRLYSEADFLSLLDELERTRSSNEAMRKALEEARESLSSKASNSYCRSLDKFSETLCLGWEAKVKSGSYGTAEHEAHAEANRLMGRHTAFAEAAKLLSEALSPSTKVNHE